MEHLAAARRALHLEGDRDNSRGPAGYRSDGTRTARRDGPRPCERMARMSCEQGGFLAGPRDSCLEVEARYKFGLARSLARTRGCGWRGLSTVRQSCGYNVNIRRPLRVRPCAGFVAVALLAASAASAQTIRGTATFRERMALPLDTTFEAVLEDLDAIDSGA